jgi:hypothetical protein
MKEKKKNKQKKVKFVWHLTKNVLFSPVVSSLQKIKNEIKEDKKETNEEKVIHLKLIKYIKGELPQEVVKQGERYVEALKRFFEAQEFCEKRSIGYGKGDFLFPYWRETYKENNEFYRIAEYYSKEILSLHKKECKKCPWWD